MSDFYSQFVVPILASAVPDPGLFLAILCQLAEGNPALEDALIAAVGEMGRQHLAEAAGLEAIRDFRQLHPKHGGTA